MTADEFQLLVEKALSLVSAKTMKGIINANRDHLFNVLTSIENSNDNEE